MPLKMSLNFKQLTINNYLILYAPYIRQTKIRLLNYFSIIFYSKSLNKPSQSADI